MQTLVTEREQREGRGGRLRAGRSGLRPGALWADLNTPSPGLKRELASIAESQGVPFADVAMMAPVPGRGLGVPDAGQRGRRRTYTRLLTPLGAGIEVLAGPAGHAQRPGTAARRVLQGDGPRPSSGGGEPPAPSATSSGCARPIAARLTRPTRGVERIVDSTAQHAVRRTTEMEAAAKMLTELGVPPVMADASRAARAPVEDATHAPAAEGFGQQRSKSGLGDR